MGKRWVALPLLEGVRSKASILCFFSWLSLLSFSASKTRIIIKWILLRRVAVAFCLSW
jgi:hypothetical protein